MSKSRKLLITLISIVAILIATLTVLKAGLHIYKTKEFQNKEDLIQDKIVNIDETFELDMFDESKNTKTLKFTNDTQEPILKSVYIDNSLSSYSFGDEISSVIQYTIQYDDVTETGILHKKDHICTLANVLIKPNETKEITIKFSAIEGLTIPLSDLANIVSGINLKADSKEIKSEMQSEIVQKEVPGKVDVEEISENTFGVTVHPNIKRYYGDIDTSKFEYYYQINDEENTQIKPNENGDLYFEVVRENLNIGDHDRIGIVMKDIGSTNAYYLIGTGVIQKLNIVQTTQ